MSVAQQRNLRLVRDFPREPGVQLGDIHLRNRLVTSSSLLGYGVAPEQARWALLQARG